MQRLSDLFGILFLLVVTSIFAYQAYRSWVDVDGLREEIRDNLESVFWGQAYLSLGFLDSPMWVVFMRLISTAGTIVCALTIVYVVLQFILGR